jgi:hypothetical protein
MGEKSFIKILKDKLSDLEEYAKKYKPTSPLDVWENVIDTSLFTLSEYKPLIKKREREKEWRLQFNENFYFGPAQKGLELNEQGILFAKNGDSQKAYGMFEQANKHFNEGSNVNNSAILLNQAKCLLENGDKAGIVFLIIYFNSQQDYIDYSVEKLKCDFNFSFENDMVQGYLFNYRFEIELIDRQKISSITTEPEMELIHIDIPYKHPVFLELEGKDKDIITLQDYEYLWKLDSNNDKTIDFEVRVPLKNWRKIFEFFNDETLLQLEATYIPLTPFEKIFLLELDNLKLPEEAQDRNYTKVSLLRVSLPKINERDFTELFQHYLKPYFPSPLSEEEMEVVLELERMKEWEDYQPDNSWELQEDYYSRFADIEHCYSLIYAYIFQSENGQKNPFANLNTETYAEGQRKFRNFFPEIFVECPLIKSPSDKYKERLSLLIYKIKSKEVTDLIKSEFEEIISLSFIYKKTDASLFHMRRALEIVVRESYYKLGRENLKENLNSMIQGINLNNNKSYINTHMNDIRITANKIIHYSKDEKSQVKITIEESRELLRKLFIVSEFLVDVFEL